MGFIKELINFVQTYWREILEVAVLLFTFLVALFKKAKIQNPSILAFIDQYLPECISHVENLIGQGKGVQKKEQVLNSMYEALQTRFHGIDEKKYKKIINDKIEIILSTPQKKGITYEKK